jgi:6-pyruvoyltetrahydropterin/6-carboxytetrahydropterin synthase
MQVFLTSDKLDNTGMVTDFRHLEWLKQWINEYVDHRFIVDRNDPLYENLIGGSRKLVPIKVPGTDYIACYQLDLSDLKDNTPEFEYYEGFTVVDFVPTSEKLSEWMSAVVDAKMKLLGVTVHRIDWWETPKSRSVFYRTAL